MARHWSERMTCICGWSTFSVTKEAYHRHNFPALCRRSRKNEGSKGPSVTTHSRTEGDLTMTQKDRDDARDLELEAGCDGFVETCDEKFSNVANFTGHSFIPATRLFLNNLHVWRG
mgnify:CR=1 FL=1